MKGTVLKILSAIAFCAVVFPFMFCCDINTYGNIDILRLGFYAGVCLVTFLLGLLGSGIGKAHKGLRIVVRIFAFLMFGAGFASLMIKGDGVTVFALGVCCVFTFFVGERFGYKNFADMFPLSAFAFYIVFALGCYIFVKGVAAENIRDTAVDVIVGSFVLEFAAAALLVNQGGIFDRANMRKETRSSLPKGLSAYNAALVMSFTLTGALICIFRKQLAWLLEQAGMIMINAVYWLTTLFKADKMETEYAEAGEVVFSGREQDPITYVFDAVVIILVLIIAFIFREKIWAAIKGLFIRLGRFFSGHPDESAKPDFKDVFEYYHTKKKRIEKADGIGAVRRKYKAETDPARKYRLGYRVLLYRIKSVNRRLSPADTTSVQAQKGAELFGEPELTAAARVYDGIRYNGDIPTSAQLEGLSELTEK